MELPKLNQVKGMKAARLRQRKFAVLETLELPPDALPGNLSLTHTRCGTPTCHFAQGEGHSVWQLTFMVEGKKRVERIPAEWVDEVRRRVDGAGRSRRRWPTRRALAALLRRAKRGKAFEGAYIGLAPATGIPSNSDYLGKAASPQRQGEFDTHSGCFLVSPEPWARQVRES
jgi:hypothetical protein